MSTTTERAAYFMRLAIAEAWQGRGFVEPNPMVGALIVRDDRVLARGHHRKYGGPHAEIDALDQATEAVEGATLYVSLEPCCHFGKTPPCSDAVIKSGIKRVVAAQRDPNPKVAGGGFRQLEAAGIEVEVGVENQLARILNGPFLKRIHTGRPYVTAKWAMTLDGKIATATGDSRWISSEISRSRVHELRGRMDAILVGIGTALRDDPQLTARPPGPRVPARIVLDPSGSLPDQSKLVSTARETPTWVVVNERAAVTDRHRLESNGCELIVLAGTSRIDVGSLLDELGRWGLTNVMIEGGGKVLGSFLDAGEVDEVDAYIAPMLEGGTHGFHAFAGQGHGWMKDASRLQNVEVEQLGTDIRVRGSVSAEWRQIG